jgi:hypothetical protein
VIVAEADGEVIKANGDEVVVKYKEGTVTTSHSTLSVLTKVQHQPKGCCSTGDKVKAGDVLIEGMSIAGRRTGTR